MIRAVVPALLVCLASSVQAQQATVDRAFVNRYCYGCHNSKVKAGSLALDGIVNEPIGQHAEVWEKVVRRLRARFMPPMNAPRPDEATYSRVVASLVKELDAAKPNPGRTATFRRLNRTEYQNSIRDLLAVDVDIASMLPADESSHGFDNITVADLSATLLERYLNAARKISRLAIGIVGRAPGGETVHLPPDLTQEEHFDELPLGTRGGANVPYVFPADAEYEIQVRLQRDRNEHVEGLREEHQVELMMDGERIGLFSVQPPPAGQDHSKVDRNLNVRKAVKAGPHVISVAFPKKPSTLLETERQPYVAHFNMDRHPRITPALYSVTINGPYQPQGAGDTPSRRRIFVCQPSGDEDACAKRIFANLAKRAYRRPVTAEDLRAPLKFYDATRAKEGFESAIEMGLRAILVSPEFLFRVERDPANAAAGTAYAISDVELASRLSFFLWSSIPDEELLEAAIKGTLKQPAVLERQVRRMLADSRSNMLATNFAGQWLYLRNLASTTPDMRSFPDFDDNLRRSFKKETELFFESIQSEDRSVLDLLRANYTYVDERLAKHYGIPNVYGSRFRRVTFGEGGARGGLLGQGSVLTVTSYATRTSPVIRGKWIMDNLIGIGPPPPPPNVPQLKEQSELSKVLSMKERMAQHRANPACSGCHALMDPVGFSLENFDAVGRWRSSESGLAIDSEGGLPDGSKFQGIAGLRKALLAKPELFTTTFTEKMMTYALGRGVEYSDAPAVRKIINDAGKDDYRFSSFIMGIVRSTPFQMRRTQ